jgi:3-oxoacyl-[acyl-carrier protein] reductase
METPDGGERAIAAATGALGPVTVVVANAVRWPVFDDELTGLRASLLANTLGPAALIDAALPAMRAAGWGRVVALSSDIVVQPMAGHSSYAAAKLGLEGVVRVLAVREARHGVLSNTVRPGYTLTERGLAAFGQKAVDQEATETPTGRICTPEDVANVVAFLASAANGHVNGQAVSVAGGRELSR